MSALANPLPLPLESENSDSTLWREVDAGSVVESVQNPTASGVLWQADKNIFTMCLTGIVRCSVERGGLINVARDANAERSDLRWFVQGLPLAACYVQRGCFVLHAAAVSTSQGAVLILGHSVTGKSTLAAALALRGFSILADEVVPVEFCENAKMSAVNGMADIQLCVNALNELHIDTNRTSATRPGLARRYVEGLPKVQTKTPVRAIYILTTHNRPQLEFNLVRGHEKMFLLMSYAFNSRLPVQDGTTQKHFGQLGAALTSVAVTKVQRPDGVWSGDELADKIVQEMSS